METIFDLGPDYKGRFFGPPFFVAEWHGIAPGWFVFGRNEEYGGQARQDGGAARRSATEIQALERATIPRVVEEV